MKPFLFLTSLLPLALFAPAYAAEEVRVYSGRHYNTDRQVYKKFSDQTGIKVRLVEASGISLVQRLKSEGKNTKADVIILVDAARINNAANAGLFAPIQSSSLSKSVPSRYRDPNKRWFGLTRRVRAIIVNPAIVNPSSVTSYSQLASPALKGKVCLRKRKNVYNQSLVADQLALKGTAKVKSWLKGLTSNVSQPYFGGDIGLIRAVAQGQCGVGVVNHYYLARMRAGVNGKKDQQFANDVKIVMPNPAHVNISAAAVSRYSKNKKNAVKLIEFLASPKGSAGIAGPTYEFPLQGVGGSTYLKGMTKFTPDQVTISQLSRYNKEAIRLITEAGWK
ncbi:extracellular solute-binding protein [Synechococcus sp. CC9311]|uniref:extracellular solute-binding protein n=1 Tax=Synechococcus sp. (strain CC9311) TaxID=64471 RepID=UPI0000DDAEF4|nr:extracellular solute-binding protein [Synechococcus sp. CC9311]ABI47656.1 ABC-type Fe3+ transport system periplasmic component [Synechococcus sp. CC9311]